jgi:hypothetical protein
MTFRVWYENGSARLVQAVNEEQARAIAKEVAELDAQDIGLAYTAAKASNPDRARELATEWQGLTTVKKVEAL